MRQVYSFYIDAFFISVKSILEYKLRAFLTLIGIIIGVASVVVVGASISGLNSYVSEKISKVLGANHFMVNRMAHSGQMDDEEFERRNRQNKNVTWEEYEYVKAKCTQCTEVGAATNAGADLNQDGIEMPSVRIAGVTANMEEIEEKTITEGRFILDAEVETHVKSLCYRRGCRREVFPQSKPARTKIESSRIAADRHRSRGNKGSMFGQPLDRNVYVPITLHLQMFEHGDGIQIHGKAADRDSLLLAIEDSKTNLRNKRKLLGSDQDTFGLVNTAEFSGQIDQFTGAIAAVVVPITMITLIVGGIVVMNIMLVSVTERTFEVGLRKALGATRKQILLQFLIESSLLCIIGGILGLLLAVGVTTLITYFLEITMTVTISYVLLSVIVSSLIGVVAGLYPAYKAAKLDPIVALTNN